MKDNVLNAALREVVSREFADIPQHENEIAYKFSDGFTRRMNKAHQGRKKQVLADDKYNSNAGGCRLRCNHADYLDRLQYSNGSGGCR